MEKLKIFPSQQHSGLLVQEMIAHWTHKNFDSAAMLAKRRDLGIRANDAAKGIGAEAGELLHAVLKYEQGIRGTAEEHIESMRDAIGDIYIYMLDFCNQMQFDFGEIVADTVEHVTSRDWVTNAETGEKKDGD